MVDKKILASIAPCGLNCEKCFAYVDGEIRKYSSKLRMLLGNFGPYAKRYETLLEDQIFKKYPAFIEMLEYFAEENCLGCRNEQCKLFKKCGVRTCYIEKKVDFCFQCEEFPCDHTNFDKNLQDAWVRINNKIAEIGIEQYYEGWKNRNRYP